VGRRRPRRAAGQWRGEGFRVQIVVDNDQDKDYDNDGRSTMIETTIGTTMKDRFTITTTITVYAERLSTRPP
ncbi:MAG: hypothetical protein WCS01_17265, partial [bacterium]